jgi:serine/threonine protein kinase
MVRDAARVKSIFLAAVERYPAEQWPVYLDGACGEDNELRDRVRRLLDAHGDQKSLHIPSPSEPDMTVDRPTVERPGDAIGPYKLMEQIGEGGMGVVYVAEQNEPVRRRVALKVIKPGMDSRQVVARFEAERQALAMMDHPNIARVFDGGTTPSGRPYFVMELVRGIPITEYCDEQKLTIRERLELFVLVCRAVQHAHQKGIIHRDLKPSNILITLHDGVPVPKVIDFGVAKATGQALTDKTIYTAFAQLIGTPLYMSPEQVELSGLDVDTRSDVYSLGVLLYELLTGTTPFDAETLRSAAFDEMRRIIREQEPQSPSVRLSSLGETLPTVSARRSVDARRLGPSLRGELDWIVMKALEKDRRRRYETANDFASDVMRYLTDQPVDACPPSAWYRLRKFARRNRPGLTTAALVAMALAGGTAVSLWQAARARGAAREASQRREESRQVVDYLAKDIFGGAARGKKGKKRSRSATVGELLDSADATLGERFREQPLVEASVRMALVDSYATLLDQGRAEQNAARAVQIRERYLGPDHPETLQALEQQAWILTCASWDLERDLPRARAAESIARRVLFALRRVRGPAHPDTLLAQSHLAITVSVLGRDDEAEALASQAEGLAAGFLGPDHDTTLMSQCFLGVITRRRGNLARAEALFRHCYQSWERDRGALDDNTLLALHHLAYTVGLQGRADEARPLWLETVNRSAQVYGLCHIQTSPHIGFLFSLLTEQHDYATIRDLCEGWLRELLAMPPEPDPYERSRCLFRLSTLVLTLATLPEPIPFDGELAVRAAEQAAEQGNDTQDNHWTRLSLVHLRLGHVEQAQWAVRESMKRRRGGDCFDSMAQALIHARRGELAGARTWFDRATRENGRDNGPPGRGYEQVRDEVAALLSVKDLPAKAIAQPGGAR